MYNAQRFNYKIEYARRFHIGVVQLVGQRTVDGQTDVAGLGMFAQTFPLVTGNLPGKNNPQKRYYKNVLDERRHETRQSAFRVV